MMKVIKLFAWILAIFFLNGCENFSSQKKNNAECGDDFILAIKKSDHREIMRFLNGKDCKNFEVEVNMGLIVAAYMGDDNVMKILVDNGADVNFVNGVGGTPLHSAIMGKDVDAVKLLIAEGAKFTDADQGVTPIMFAAYVGSNDIIKLLMRYGQDPNKAQPDGTTPIVIAIAKNHEDTVFYLLQVGVNLNGLAPIEPGGEPKSVLQIAQHYGNPKIIMAIQSAIVKGAEGIKK